MSSPPLVVHGIAPCYGMPSASPFVVKLLTWLRMAGIPHERHDLGRPPASRNAKVPYVTLPDGRVLEDSQHIIETLAAERGIDPWEGLTAWEQALAHHLRNTIEGSLYWGLVWERWCTEDGLEPYVQPFFSMVPAPMRGLVAGQVRRITRKQAWQQGVNRRPPEQVRELARRDLSALAAILGQREWFLGVPTLVDASAYGHLLQLHTCPVENPTVAAYRAHPELVAHTERVRARWWADADGDA